MPLTPGSPATSASDGASRRKARLAVVSLVVLLGAELAIVLLAAGKASLLAPPKRIPFTGWRAGPLQGLLAGLSHDRTALKIIFVVLIVAMGACYGLVLRHLRTLPWPRVLCGIVVAHLIALLGPPLILSDVFNYLDYARLGVVHHLNPYLHPPHAAAHDPIYRYTSWRFQATPYGPLFTLATYPLARLNIPLGLWILKLTTVAASLGCVGLVAACARRLGRPVTLSAAAIGLNPLLLIYGVGGVHNDFFMMALALAGLYWLLGDRQALGGVALVASAAVKLASAPLIPFLLIGAQRRLRALIGALFAAAALVIGAIAVFGASAPGVTDQAGAVTRFSLPDDIAAILGVRVTTRCAGHFYPCLNPTISVLATATLVGALAFLLWRAWRGADPIACAGWAAVALLLSLTSVMPWYMLWVLPFAVLSRSRPLQITAGVLGVLLVMASQPVAHLLVYGA
ncbi:MAG: DUF2029 domain-containing protein [Actinomycetota bacterium]|nr:DUF2029 domain-containing protein [Actinomycetota bacterium]